jgi:hypothetical protein
MHEETSLAEDIFMLIGLFLALTWPLLLLFFI